MKGITKLTAASGILLLVLITGCNNVENKTTTGISPQAMADALHSVMQADRTVYAKYVVNRLVNEEKVIKASEHWQDDKALPLPAQMFRLGSEQAAQEGATFSYSLISEWAINPKNAPKTDAEKQGVKFISANPGQNFYTEETLGDKKYFTAIYPDAAVAKACVSCHNDHQDSPKSDFKLRCYGRVIIRIPM